MRVTLSLVFAGALFTAAPVLSQNNAATSVNEVTANAEANAAAPVTPPEAAATPGTQNAALPPTATTVEETGAAPVVARKSRPFPWGVLGLLGLIGLLGVRKAKG